MELEQKTILSLLPPRPAESNKGHYGKLLVAAGSRRFRGAAQLCALGGLRIGAGIVTLAAIEPVIAAASACLPEPVFLPLSESWQGGIAAAEAEALLHEACRSSAAVLGCGMGNTPDTACLARTLALQCPGTPLVLDADGLNAVAGNFPVRKEPGLVITPHPGEMARLTGTTIAQIEADRAGTALRFAESCNCVVVLKGHRTVIASPEGELAVNTTGNSGMARGGSGDLLAGMLGGLLAQGLAPFAAAKCAVWLHGKAGDLCAARLSRQAMLPHDMLDDLCAFLAQNGL